VSAVDRDYTDPRLAALYEPLNPWGPCDDYYLELIRSAASVLDLGCGAGQLLRRAAAEDDSRALVGVDVAPAMLAEAARADTGVVWLHGDARTVDVGRRFELATMTGHAFQVLLTDDDVRAVLSNVWRHLGPGGRFAFETRNPSARAWERWAGLTSRVESPTGEDVEVTLESVRLLEPDLVELSGTYRFEASRTSLESRGTLRFIDPQHLRALLEGAGYRIDGWFGDWDRTPVTSASPEMIVVATRP
jgi:SAM-dependent methyltransferase